MSRTTRVSFWFAACFGVVLAAAAWATTTVLRLDKAESSARVEAAWESDIRLALWTMDSDLAPRVALENARPYFAYQVGMAGSFPTFDPWTGEVNRESGSTIPTLEEPFAKLYFQFDEEGRLTSPQCAAAAIFSNRDEVDTGSPAGGPASLSQVDADPVAKNLNSLASIVGADDLLASVPPLAEAHAAIVGASAGRSTAPDAPSRQVVSRGRNDFANRSQNVMNNSVVAQNNGELSRFTDVQVGPMSAVWKKGELLLARRVESSGRRVIQGCWIDSVRLNARLLALVADLVPEAKLVPRLPNDDQDESRLLAALPLRLEPGQPANATVDPRSPLRWSLFLGWVCILAAGVVGGLMLRGVISLSERRAAFVSAVTHELRTPLTTFRLYADLLAAGIVPEARRAEYYRTLRSEADRLGHLVENVLAYARLERGRRPAPSVPGPLAPWMSPVLERLRSRATSCGMDLVVEGESCLSETMVQVDPTAVEQILFNLVDNASKYAANASDRRVHLRASRRDRSLFLDVSDHGPGIPPDVRRRLFRPLSKSAQEAANSAPGIGMGLPLSRRLAREMGGDLTYENPPGWGGTCFRLRLPTIEA